MTKDKKINGLEKAAASLAGATIGTEYFLCYNNSNSLHTSALNVQDRFRWLPIEQSNFGDAPEMFAAIMASGVVADKIESYGKNKGNKFIESLGRYFPALTSVIVGAHYTLGETILPQLLPGTADSNDVPAVLLTAAASYILSSIARKSGIYDKTVEKFRELRTITP